MAHAFHTSPLVCLSVAGAGLMPKVYASLLAMHEEASTLLGQLCVHDVAGRAPSLTHLFGVSDLPPYFNRGTGFVYGGKVLQRMAPQVDEDQRGCAIDGMSRCVIRSAPWPACGA